jgi:hypothetical protein
LKNFANENVFAVVELIFAEDYMKRNLRPEEPMKRSLWEKDPLKEIFQ